MPQDAFTLKHLCIELNELLVGGKINRIVEPSNDDVVFTVYTGKKTVKLLLSVNPAMPRIGIINEEAESPLTAPNFCMLLRKHLLSSTVTNLELVGFDRIVKMDFLTSAEFTDSTVKTLYIELMGRYSNIILTENGKILGGNRGINMFDNGVRPLIVGQPYVFPPVGDKKLPTDKSLVDVFDGVDASGFADAICSNVQGIAKSTADEISFTYKGQNGSGKEYFNHLNDFINNVKKSPCVIEEGGEVKDVLVYPYNLIKGDKIDFDSLYLAEDFYFSKREKLKDFKRRSVRLTSIVSAAIKKTKKKLVAINAKRKDASEAEENRLKGELILANVYKFKGGEKTCTLLNYYDNTEITIALDERLSAAKNAEKYYKKYNKQKRTLEALEPQLSQAEKELDYLLGVMEQIELAETVGDLFMLKEEMEQEGLISEKQRSKRPKKLVESFCREYVVDGVTIKAGRNNAENDKLTFTAKKDDVWLHAKDYHSSHVIISADGKTVSDKVLVVAAEICAYYSKGRLGGKTEVVYTERKNVKKPPKSKLGFCTYDNFKSIVVTPDKHAELTKGI